MWYYFVPKTFPNYEKLNIHLCDTTLWDRNHLWEIEKGRDYDLYCNQPSGGGLLGAEVVVTSYYFKQLILYSGPKLLQITVYEEMLVFIQYKHKVNNS